MLVQYAENGLDVAWILPQNQLFDETCMFVEASPINCVHVDVGLEYLFTYVSLVTLLSKVNHAPLGHIYSSSSVTTEDI